MQLSGNVSTVSIAFMFIAFILSVFVPIGGIIYLSVKKRLKLKSLLFGALFFIVFALILEQIMHILVLRPYSGGSFISRTPLLYGLYGALAAGIFEETARLIGLKFVIRVKDNESINTGISYGLGHGSVEALIIGGMAAVSNIANSFLINNGTMESLLKRLTTDQADQAVRGCNVLITTPSYMFLISGTERLVALALQISLTLIVFKAVTDRKWILFIAAIAIHAVVDFPAGLFQAGMIKNIFVIELLVLVFTVLCALFAYKIHHVSSNTAPDEDLLK